MSQRGLRPQAESWATWDILGYCGQNSKDFVKFEDLAVAEAEYRDVNHSTYSTLQYLVLLVLVGLRNFREKISSYKIYKTGARPASTKFAAGRNLPLDYAGFHIRPDSSNVAMEEKGICS